MALNHNGEEQQKTLAASEATDNFLKAYQRMPPEMKPKFREVNFKMSAKYPQAFLKYWSSDEKQHQEGWQMLKDREQELASKLHFESVKYE